MPYPLAIAAAAAVFAAQLLLCLRVMRDVGLVAAVLNGTALSIRMLHREGKADLDAHPLVMHLRKLRQKYSEGR